MSIANDYIESIAEVAFKHKVRRDMSKLKKGWHFGQGEVINDIVIDKTLELLQLAKPYNFYPQVFPLIDGGINLSLMINDEAAELIINPDLTIDTRIEKGIGKFYAVENEKENATYRDILNSFEIIYSRNIICLSEYFPTHITITTKKGGTKAPLSETVQTKAVSPWLTSSVYMPTITRSVRI